MSNMMASNNNNNNNNNKDNATASCAPKLTKKQKGRLKKLRRRAQQPITGLPTSGLVVPSDWTELQELLSASNSVMQVGPSIKIRKGQDSIQKADGADHRDVLWNMVLQYLTALSKKRKRNDDPLSCPRVPPWSTLHNPCTIQSMAIVEIQIDSNVNEIQQHVPVLSSLNKSKTVVTVETRWFQGHQQLKTPTDVLMYASSSKISASHRTKRIKWERDKDLDKYVLKELQKLVVPESDRKKEGFPIMQQTEKQKGTNEYTTAPVESGLPSLDQAKHIVQSAAVSVQDVDGGEIFVVTTNACENDTTPRVFAVDCEMVKTKHGAELARVTLLQLTGIQKKTDEDVSYSVVLDEFVKPHDTVLDHVTEYSGITAAILDKVTTRLEQIQAAMVSIIHSNDIIVGHSLENDLRALRLVHDKVVDTALVFRAKKGRRKYSLRHLSATLLDKTIQSNHGADGHCSEEDAAAALNLAVRRAREGPSFCIKERGDDQLHLLERIHDGPVVCIGPNEWLQQHVTQFPNSAHALTCENMTDPNRKAVVAWLTSPTRRAKLVWSRLVAEDQNDLAKVNEFLSEVVERMLPGTLLLICIQSNLAKAEEEAKQRKICMDPRSSLGWTVEQDQNFQRLADKCRSGMAFWIGDSSIETTTASAADDDGSK